MLYNVYCIPFLIILVKFETIRSTFIFNFQTNMATFLLLPYGTHRVTEVRIKMSRRIFNRRMHKTTSTTPAKCALCSAGACTASYKICTVWCVYKNMIKSTHKESKNRRIKITPKQRLIYALLYGSYCRFLHHRFLHLTTII